MFDVLIVGGGMVGASLACALGRKPLKIGLIEPNPALLQGEYGADGRACAVALGSSWVWQAIGIWPQILAEATPMHTIQISDQDFPWLIKLQRQQVQESTLGYVVENRVTLAAAWQTIRHSQQIQVFCPDRVEQMQLQPDAMEVMLSSGQQLHTKLLVAADGGRSQIRQLAQIGTVSHTYNQTCIVFNLKLEHSHHNIAHERFQASGPFAILPLGTGDRCCVVWTAQAKEAEQILALPVPQFLAQVSQRLGSDLCQSFGKITLDSPPTAYHPRWMHSQTYIQPRLVLVGDAAHSTHPVAGQGMNLGIRDVGVLAETLWQAHQRGSDLGSLEVLKTYQRSRRWHNFLVICLTDVTNRLFSNQFFLLKLIRRLGLILVSWLPIKQLVTKFLMGITLKRPQLSSLNLD